MSFFIIPSLNICEGILLQREQPAPAKERAGAIEKLDVARESGPEVASGCPGKKEGERKGNGEPIL